MHHIHPFSLTRFGMLSVAAGISVLLSALPVRAASSLQDVVAEALAGHPELGAIRFNRRAIDHELTAARGLRLPTIDVQAEGGRHKDYDRTALGVRTGGDVHWHREAQIVGSQRIFDGFESRYEIERQKNRVESARWRVMDTANSVALRAVQAYLELQRADAVLKASRDNLRAHRGLLSRVDGRVSGGRAASSDLSEAQSRTLQAEALVAEAEGRLRDAEALFRSVVGRAPGRLAPATVARVRPANVEQAVAHAVEFAPSVLATQHDVATAEAAIGSAYGRMMPRANLEVSTHRGWGMTEDGDRSLDSRAMLVVRWNLFNGGIDKARIWEAKSRSYEAAEISANTRRTIERETRTSWNDMQTAQKRVPLLRRQVDSIRSTRRAYDDQFDAGSRRLLDILNVQSELFVAEAALRTEQFIGVYNSYRLLAAMGTLVSALGLDAPPEAAIPHAPTLVDGWRDGWQTYRSDVDALQARSDAGPARPAK